MLADKQVPARRSSYFYLRGARATAKPDGETKQICAGRGRIYKPGEGTQVTSRRLASQKSLSAGHMFARHADADFRQPIVAERKAVGQSITPRLGDI
jgi:hypothetical protein